MSTSDYASREHRTCVMMYPLAAVPPEKAEPPSRQRRTRIVCTLGPSSASRDVIVRLIRAGLDVARLNFSHGTHETHAATLATLRAAAAEVGRPVGVLQDLCGPKIRVGEMPGGGVDVTAGQVLRFRYGGGEGCLPVEYEDLAADVHAGDRILFDDGTIEARVNAVDGDVVSVRFERAGRLKTRKGMNLPGVKVSAPSVTQKDLEDLEWGLANGVDFVALSFIRSAEDLAPVRERLAREADPPLLISKLETPEAIDDLDRILHASDAVMVARGDLGVEMDFQRVPMVQKRIIRRANELDVPVITATQMLESMTGNPRPTRAEASDVANAILDGTDAVMLSGETASGRFPVESVHAMSEIAIEAEAWAAEHACDPNAAREAAPSSLHDALALGVERIARDLNVRAIAVATLGGDTARFVASARPRVPILVVSPSPRALGRSCLFWGCRAALCPPFDAATDAMNHAEAALRGHGLVRPGEVYVLAVGRGPSREFAARIHVRELGAGPDAVSPA